MFLQQQQLIFMNEAKNLETTLAKNMTNESTTHTHTYLIVYLDDDHLPHLSNIYNFLDIIYKLLQLI